MFAPKALPEGYLEARAQIKKRDETKAVLVASINRYLNDGVREFTLRDLEVFGANDWPQIKSFLDQWESRGLLRIIKPVGEASKNDVVIEILNYID